MSDFHQNGVIATLHNFKEKSLDQIESDLLKFSSKNPMTLILPSLYSELERPALTYIVNTLEKIKYIKNIVVFYKLSQKISLLPAEGNFFFNVNIKNNFVISNKVVPKISLQDLILKYSEIFKKKNSIKNKIDLVIPHR